MAEVKSGDEAPDPLLRATRRQLLEYAVLVPEVAVLLLVDMEAGRVHEVTSPASRRAGRAPEPLVQPAKPLVHRGRPDLSGVSPPEDPMTSLPPSVPGPDRLVPVLLDLVADSGRLRGIARGLGLRTGGSRAELAARIGGSVGPTLPELTELLRLLRKAELVPLCRQFGLPEAGDRQDLLDRLLDRLELTRQAPVTAPRRPPHEGADPAAWEWDEDEPDEDEDDDEPGPMFLVLMPMPRAALGRLASAVGLPPVGGRAALHGRLCNWVGRRGERVEAVLARLTTADLRRAADLLELRAGGRREQVLGRLRAWFACVGGRLETSRPAVASGGPELLLGRWVPGRMLRIDARGTTREVTDLRLPERPGRHVAVIATRPDDRRLRRQVEVGLRLAHPYAVRAVDAGVDEAGNDVGIFVDPGEPLATWLERRGTPEAACVRRWLLPVAAALDEAHGQGMLHGALDVDALFVDEAHVARVGGFSLLASPGGAVDLTGGAAPTPAAPETNATGYVSAASDRWGFARLAVFLRTGRRVERPDEIAALDLPEGARSALAAGLDPDPRRRPATCFELALAVAGP